MRQVGRHEKDGHLIAEMIYGEDSFDLLFVSTPGGDYRIEWKYSAKNSGVSLM